MLMVLGFGWAKARARLVASFFGCRPGQRPPVAVSSGGRA